MNLIKTAKEPDKNIDSNCILILGKENFLSSQLRLKIFNHQLNNMSGQKINFIFLIFLVVVNIFLFSERPRGEEISGATFAIILEFLALIGLNLFLKIYRKEQVHFLKNTLLPQILSQSVSSLGS